MRRASSCSTAASALRGLPLRRRGRLPSLGGRRERRVGRRDRGLGLGPGHLRGCELLSQSDRVVRRQSIALFAQLGEPVILVWRDRAATFRP